MLFSFLISSIYQTSVCEKDTFTASLHNLDGKKFKKVEIPTVTWVQNASQTGFSKLYIQSSQSQKGEPSQWEAVCHTPLTLVQPPD